MQEQICQWRIKFAENNEPCLQCSHSHGEEHRRKKPHQHQSQCRSHQSKFELFCPSATQHSNSKLYCAPLTSEHRKARFLWFQVFFLKEFALADQILDLPLASTFLLLLSNTNSLQRQF